MLEAEAIMDYMVLNGIDEDRLKAKGYWMSLPIISKEEIDKFKGDRQKQMTLHFINRRTEFKIIGH